MPAAGANSDSKTRARGALCGAVQFVIGRGEKKRNWRAKTIQLATQSYGVSGGAAAGNQAIMNALQEYGRGEWDETQCPPPTKLMKGAIREVLQ